MPPRHSRHSGRANPGTRTAGAAALRRGRPTGFLDGFRAWLRVAPAAWTNRKRRSRVVALPLEPRPDEDPSVALPGPASAPRASRGGTEAQAAVPTWRLKFPHFTCG